MDKTDIKLLIAIGFICVGIGFLFGVGIALIPEDKCIRNPLYYGISSLETDTLKINCNCYFNNWGYAPFFFNKTGVFALNGGN